MVIDEVWQGTYQRYQAAEKYHNEWVPIKTLEQYSISIDIPIC